MAKRPGQAYESNSVKHPAPGKGKFSTPDSGGKAPDMGEQSKAPADKPSMQPSVPSGPWDMPESGGKAPDMGAQSKPPEHKKKEMTLKNAPVGVKGVNGGTDFPLPKGGGKGETEV
jgi:hypothetical protein